MPMIPSAPTAQIVAVGTFSHESPVTAPVAKLAASVQPGSFGDAKGSSSEHRGVANISVKGEFDLPTDRAMTMEWARQLPTW